MMAKSGDYSALARGIADLSPMDEIFEGVDGNAWEGGEGGGGAEEGPVQFGDTDATGIRVGTGEYGGEESVIVLGQGGSQQ